MKQEKIGNIFNKDTVRGPRLKQVNIDNKEKFKDYVDYIKKQRLVLEKRVETLKTAQFIGKYYEYITKELSEEIERLKGTTMMVHQERKLGQVTDRKIHVYNAANIAYKISKGIFKDEDISKGIKIATLIHDIGQPALGHDGEDMASKVSLKRQAGPRPHNATGATQILYRSASKIRKAINKGIAMEMIQEEAKMRNISIEEMSNKLKEGNEAELEDRMKSKSKELENQINDAIQLLAMSAGRHNGERGTANILPNYEITFSDFKRVLEKCFVYEGADKEMQSANMIDAIVKISDQISSIPYDMIDGKKGGIVIDIPENYAEPVSKILGIEKQEALKKLKGENYELEKIVADIQETLIENLIDSSNKEIIRLELDSLLYGKKDRLTGETIVQGLRMPTYAEYLPYTSGEEEVRILQEAWYKCAEKLSNEILQADGMFSRQLNAIFRMNEDDIRREKYEESLMQQYNGKDEYKDFMEYVLKTTPQEYQFIKRNCHEYGVNLLRQKIKMAKESFKSEKSHYISSSDDEIEQGILNYIYSSSKGIPEPAEGQEYTDEEINEIYREINNMRSLQGKKKLLLQQDERIATQLALGYMEYRFNDTNFINFCIRIGAITEDEARIVRTPYDPVSKVSYIPDNLAATGKAYAEAEQEI